jgi:hypothetical protein
MQDWKINQKIYQSLAVKQDILGEHISNDIIRFDNSDLICSIKKQFNDLDIIWLPAKSYCVALVFAYYLSKEYGDTIASYLNDDQLLLDDMYFVPYFKNKKVYDALIAEIESLITTPMAMKIYNYYRKEIHLEGFEYAK